MVGYNKIGVLGCGAFGVALAKVSSVRCREVYLWGRNQEVCDGINRDHTHKSKLSHITLPDNLRASTNLEEVVSKSNAIILALPMSAMAEVLQLAAEFISPNAILVSCAKGICFEKLEFSCDIIKNIVPKNIAARSCYLSGPSFASELAHGLPTALTLASETKETALDFQRHFSTENCRLYVSDDVPGVCVGGALKNVIAIAAGVCTALDLGHNALASLITRGLREITRFGVALGARYETFSGLSGVGDLLLSCTDNMSRNHQLGTFLASGIELELALKKIGSVVEGAKTAKAINSLMSKYHVDMPICQSVFRVLYDKVPPREAISALLLRKLKEENF